MRTSDDRRGLEAAVIEALEPVALNCPNRDCSQLEWDEIVRVSDFEVREAAWCQAKVAGPPEPFVADIFKTFRAISLRAAGRLDDTSSVTEAVSSAMQLSRSGTDWLAKYLNDEPESVRIQIATRSVSWLTRTLEMLDERALPEWERDVNLDWRYPGFGLMLRGKIPLVRPDDTSATPVLVIPSPSEAWDDTIAYLAVVWRLCARRAADHAVVLVHSTGERREVVLNELLDRGLVAAERAAVAVSSRLAGPTGLTRTPSFFTCDGCAWFETCAERAANVNRPLVRGGVRLG